MKKFSFLVFLMLTLNILISCDDSKPNPVKRNTTLSGEVYFSGARVVSVEELPVCDHTTEGQVTMYLILSTVK